MHLMVKRLSAAYGQELSPDVFNLIFIGDLPPGGSAQITLCKIDELKIEADSTLRFALSSVLKDRYTPQDSKDLLSEPGRVQNVHHTVNLTY